MRPFKKKLNNIDVLLIESLSDNEKVALSSIDFTFTEIKQEDLHG